MPVYLVKNLETVKRNISTPDHVCASKIVYSPNDSIYWYIYNQYMHTTTKTIVKHIHSSCKWFHLCIHISNIFNMEFVYNVLKYKCCNLPERLYGPFYDTMQIYKATLPVVSKSGLYNFYSSQHLNLSQFKQTLHN